MISSWRGGLFPWALTFCFLCSLRARSSCHPVRSFDTIYHPTDFTVMNETFRKLYAVFVIRTTKNHHTHTHTTDVKQRFVSLPPQLYFFTQLQKVVFFNVSRTLTAMQNSGLRLGAPWTHNKVRLIFLRFYQKVFNDGTTFSSCFLNCTTVPLYYILRIKLWYCSEALVPSCSCVQAFLVHRPLWLKLWLGQSFGLQTGDKSGDVLKWCSWSSNLNQTWQTPKYVPPPPAVPRLTGQVQWVCREKKMPDLPPNPPVSSLWRPVLPIPNQRSALCWSDVVVQELVWLIPSSDSRGQHSSAVGDSWSPHSIRERFCLTCWYFVGLWCFFLKHQTVDLF